MQSVRKAIHDHAAFKKGMVRNKRHSFAWHAFLFD
jgi:hypothetical protein